MDRIALIDGFDAGKVRETLNVMLRDKGHEFQELAKTLNIPQTSDDWQVIVLKFCLDFEDCLNIWTDSEEPNSIKNTKCMTIMREIAKGKKNFSEIINMQNVAQTLFSEFHQTYKRID
ncbi:MAG: hypothetical protein ACE5RS_06375 [Nitrosopumilus sp.]|nr:hypothetical protein [Nitrosopumilus sp.]